MSHSEAEVKIEKHPEGVASIGSHRPIADGNPTEVERQRNEKRAGGWYATLLGS